MAGALVLTHGLPGAGKSSLADFLEARYGSVVTIAERDRIRLDLFGSDYFDLDQYQPENEAKVTAAQHRLIKKSLAAGQLVIASDTNLNPLRIRELASIASEFDAPIFDLHLNITEVEAKSRNEHRAAGGGRLVPNPIIDEMATYGYSNNRIRRFTVRLDSSREDGFSLTISDRQDSDPTLAEEIAELDSFVATSASVGSRSIEVR